MRGLIHFRRAPRSELRELQPFSQLFDRFFVTPFGVAATPDAFDGHGDALWAPSIELKETDEGVVVRAELPGVDPKDVDVELDDGRLVLSGRREEREEKKEGETTFSEFRFGSFRRVVELPAPVDAESVKATCEKGVLTVELQKATSSKSRKIPVQARS
jgi:HSP20 family protein